MKLQIKPSILNVSSMRGTACVEVVAGKGKELDFNETVEAILETGFSLISIIGSLEKYPDIAPLVKGLTDTGKSVVITTKAEDDISALRNCRNVKFVVFAVPPTAEENTINQQTINCLKEKDELYFVVKSKEDIDSALAYQANIYLKLPTIVFHTTEPELEVVYLEKASKMNFKNRVGL